MGFEGAIEIDRDNDSSYTSDHQNENKENSAVMSSVSSAKSNQQNNHDTFHASKKRKTRKRKKASQGKTQNNTGNHSSRMPSQNILPPNFFSDLKYNSVGEREEYIKFLYATKKLAANARLIAEIPPYDVQRNRQNWNFFLDK